MTKPVLVLAVLGLALITFTGMGHATNCEDLLGDNIYRCQGKSEFGVEPFDECFRFSSTTPTVSSKFDLTVDGLEDTLGCSCKAKGNFTTPTWNDSKEWVCVTPSSGFTWGGKVGGKGKISKVYAADAGGITYTFNCVIDPACVNSGPTVETLTVYGTKNQEK
jgi:hypothetical protein